MICTTKQYFIDNYEVLKKRALEVEICEIWSIRLNKSTSFIQLLGDHDSVAYMAYLYATEVVEGRWPPGEAAIATRHELAYRYAKEVLRGPWCECSTIDKQTQSEITLDLAERAEASINSEHFLSKLYVMVG